MAESLFKEKWIQGVALTTTILAVCAALSTLRGGGFSTKVQVTTTQENNQWSYFQAKSTKQHICEMQVQSFEIDKLMISNPAVQDSIDSKIAQLKKNIARYDKEKADIKKAAEDLNKSQLEYKSHSGSFGVASMLLQIAIMLSSVGALMKKKWMWFAGLALGIAGIIYMINGFVLFFVV